MTCSISFETKNPFEFDAEVVFRAAVEATLHFVSCPYESCVCLLITDRNGIREMNRDYRKIDAVTDVLSFPLNEFAREGCFDGMEENPAAFEPDSGELLLGDIVLCAERVLLQAEEYGHSVLREFAFLIVHSMLHLIGYDHLEESERVRMEEAQKTIMQTLEISR